MKTSENAKTTRGAARALAFRNRRGEQIEPARFTATSAKRDFAHVLEVVLQGGVVLITKHNAPKVVLISVDEFNALSEAKAAKLDNLTRQFDTRLAEMQTPKARRGMKTAFGASPKSLGKAAVKFARKRA